jgi:hypothetical protein
MSIRKSFGAFLKPKIELFDFTEYGEVPVVIVYNKENKSANPNKGVNIIQNPGNSWETFDNVVCYENQEGIIEGWSDNEDQRDKLMKDIQEGLRLDETICYKTLNIERYDYKTNFNFKLTIRLIN